MIVFLHSLESIWTFISVANNVTVNNQVWKGSLLGISATGRTLSDDPITMIKSHTSLSNSICL